MKTAQDFSCLPVEHKEEPQLTHAMSSRFCLRHSFTTAGTLIEMLCHIHWPSIFNP